MIDFEVGDAVFWLSLDGGKPFPINIYCKKGEWTYQAHKDLTKEENIKVSTFVKDIIRDMKSLWKQNMHTRLPWNLGR